VYGTLIRLLNFNTPEDHLDHLSKFHLTYSKKIVDTIHAIAASPSVLEVLD
jgi:hypothetical protein